MSDGNRCGDGHPLTPENVYRRASGREECRICRAAEKRTWKEAHRDRVRQRSRDYDAAHPDKALERKKRWKRTHPAAVKAQRKRWLERRAVKLRETNGHE